MNDLKSYLIVDGEPREITGKALSLSSWLRGRDLEESKALNITPKSLAEHYASCPWVQRCVSIRANMISGIPWAITRGENELSINDLPVDILTHVNPELNYIDLMRATSNDFLIFGSAYWRVAGAKYKEGTKPKFLLRLNPMTISTKADKAGIQSFTQQLSGDDVEYKRDEIIYYHTYNPVNDIGGLSPLASCISDIDTIRSAATYTAKFFENGAMPALLVSVTGSTEMTAVGKAEIKKISAMWKRKAKGVSNAGKTMFIGKTIKVEPVSLAIDKMALKEIKLEARRAICAALEVPMSVAGAHEAANRATSQEQRESLYQDIIFPQCRYIEGVINAEYLPRFGSGLEFKFLTNEMPFMQKNELETAQKLAILVPLGIVSPQVAAEEMGYKYVKPEEEAPERSEKSKKAETDLDLWERKCIKRAKAGKGIDCKFRTDELTEGQQEAVHAALKEAKTIADIRSIFAFGRYP